MPKRKHRHTGGARRAKAAPQSTPHSSQPFKFQFTPRNINIPDEELIADLRRVAQKLRTKRLTKETYRSHGKYGHPTIFKRFGSWAGALAKVGLTPGKKVRFYELELFQNMEHVWLALGHQPSRRDLCLPPSKISICPYDHRFGGLQRAIRAFLKWKAKNPTPATNSQPAPPPPNTAHKIPRSLQPGRAINSRLRYLILKRDHFKCQSCGRSPANQPNVILHIDHIKPWSAGGQTIKENLQTLCQQCNAGKSNL